MINWTAKTPVTVLFCAVNEEAPIRRMIVGQGSTLNPIGCAQMGRSDPEIREQRRRGGTRSNSISYSHHSHALNISMFNRDLEEDSVCQSARSRLCYLQIHKSSKLLLMNEEWMFECVWCYICSYTSSAILIVLYFPFVILDQLPLFLKF